MQENKFQKRYLAGEFPLTRLSYWKIIKEYLSRERAQAVDPSLHPAGWLQKPLPQGIVLGCQGGRKTTTLVDSDDVHVLMIGASGVGKTAISCTLIWDMPAPAA